METLQEITCPICQQYVRIPRSLPCLHSFCESCLKDYIYSRGYESQPSFPCFVCQVTTSLPPAGVSAFPYNFLLESLMGTLRDQGKLTEIGPTQTAINTGSDCQIPTHPNSSYVHSDRNIGVIERENPSGPSVLRVPNMGSYSQALDVPVRNNQHYAKVSFGKYGDGLAHFNDPVGLCFTNRFGETKIHIADRTKTRVLSFKIDGLIDTIFTTQGLLHAIASNGINNLYLAVSQSENKEAMVISYDLQGVPLGKYGHMFTWLKPNAVAFDTKLSNLVATSTEATQAFIFNNQGKLVQKFGKKGKGPSSFLTPEHVTVNNYSQIIVSDRESHCVKVFDRLGHSKFTVGSRGNGLGQLCFPRGVALDPRSNNIIVADSGNHRIQVFNPAGTFVEMLFNNLDKHGFPPSSGVYADSISLCGTWLAILFKGDNFAEVRVYEYYGSQKSSKACVCQ